MLKNPVFHVELKPLRPTQKYVGLPWPGSVFSSTPGRSGKKYIILR